MSASLQPTLESLNTCDRDAFVAATGHLFEHSPWVAAGTYSRRPFGSMDELHRALCETMRDAPENQRLDLVRAHPDLAGRLAQAGQLTEASTREQSATGLDRLSQGEAAEIKRLNGEYRARFGFPFVICARLNAKEAILAAMRARMSNSPQEELSTALGEIAKIARLRLNEAIKKEN